MPVSTFVRAHRYRLAPELNPGKLAALEAVHAEWVRTLALAFHWHWTPFMAGGLFPYKPACSGPHSTFPATRLVTSQKDMMARAIVSQAKGWASNLKNRITRSVMSSEALAGRPLLRRQLLWVNAMRAWLLPLDKQRALLAAQPHKADALTELSPQASRWMRKLVRRYIELHRLPDPLQLPLQVNQLSSVMAPAQETRSPWACRWLTVSTLERGQRIALPVMDNPYARAHGGIEATTFSLLRQDHGWEVLAARKQETTPWTEHRTAVLAIDLGLRNLMATSEGDVYGRGFLDELRRRDDQLMALQKGLQGAGIVRLAQCRRYQAFVERMRGWLKTTVQTALARCLALHRPAKVVVEDLLFAGQPGLLSRRMNRLLRRFGQRYFLQTLKERAEEFGFELEHVNPAYSSQTCSGCGFVHRGNRDGDHFHCLSCGRRAHADVNAAQNLTRRSGQEATPRAGERRTYRMRALEQWSARLRATLAQATPGSMRHQRAVGGARAGLTRLMNEKRPASLQASESSAWSGLLEELRCALPGGTLVPSVEVSTRNSG